MTTTRPARKAAPAAEVPTVEPAATQAPETPGAAEPDAAAPGSGQESAPEGERHEPALDEAQPYSFTEHARRALLTPWPAFADPPVIFTPEARAAMNDFDASTDAGVEAALAETARACQDGVRRANEHLDAWLQMRARRFPAHAA